MKQRIGDKDRLTVYIGSQWAAGSLSSLATLFGAMDDDGFIKVGNRLIINDDHISAVKTHHMTLLATVVRDGRGTQELESERSQERIES